MLKQYIKIAFRSFRKNSFYTLVNILGLAVGIATFILIAIFIHFHLSFDRFQEHYDQIYRIDRIMQMKDKLQRSDQSWFPLAHELKDHYPEVVEAVVTRPVWGEYISSSKDRTFFESYGLYAENSIFNMFHYEFIEGSPENALTETFSMVLSEKMAKKYFPGESALGKTLRVRNKYDYRVTGVYRDLPENTFFYGRDYITSMKSFGEIRDMQTKDNWEHINFLAYIMLSKETPTDELDTRYTEVLHQFVQNTDDQVHLTPLKRLHLFSNDIDKTHILLIVYGLLAILSLLVASINFVNLTTALATTRAKEIGIKKVIGSYKRGLIKQFLTEAVFITLSGLLLAFILTYLLLPLFGQVMNEHLTLNLGTHGYLILGIVLFILLIGLVSGLYPALFFSSFNAVEAMKNPFSMGGKRSKFRKALVTTQFILTSMIIFSTIIIFEQFSFMKNKSLGFNTKNVLTAHLEGDPSLSESDCKALISELRQIPGVRDITISGYLPFHGYNSWLVNWEGSLPDEKIDTRRNWVEHNYFSFYDVDLVSGRYFSEGQNKEQSSCIINETFARKLGWDDPVGKRIYDNQYTIIGVVRDYHVYSVFNKIPPCVFLRKVGDLSEYNAFSVKTDKRIDKKKIIAQLNNTLTKYTPSEIVEFKYYNDITNDDTIKTYNGITKTFTFFAFVTILLSLFGLFGLVSFSLKRRTKEVGIRKSLGSRVSEIFALLAKDYAIILIISTTFGLPTAYIFMLIDPAAYKPPVNWYHLGLGFVSILVIAFASIGYHTYRASVVNPVKALRYE
jgi:putative ABC transport system permease protein